MIVTVSTVKDTLAHVQRFVTGNLGGGVDHMFVFLDAADPEVRAYLDEHPHVTCVRTDKSWWLGQRPAELNVRQRINANVVKALLDAGGWADWLFHIDGDEIAQIDRAALAAVPAAAQAVRLAPLEAVSRQRWDGEPTWFKRLLGKGDLTLLATLGVIDKPTNGEYFHGHIDGKTGVRPSLEGWLTLHHVVDAERNRIEPHSDARLRLLHYESYSGEDFVRKWTSILQAGPMASFRPVREPTAVALQTLIGKDLTPEQARPYLMRIFERTTQDDFETLRDLGLLEEIDPSRGRHRPAVFEQHAEMTALLEALRGVPKQQFHPGEPLETVRRTLAGLGAAGVSAEGAAGGGEPVKAARRFLRRS